MNLKQNISNVVVAGAGTMGRTLARLFAEHGYSVTLWNHRQPTLDAARAVIEAANPAAAVTYTTDTECFRTADFVSENISEKLDLKRDFYRMICPLVSDDTVLTSNTSGLRVTDIAEAVTKPERFCGMHWWNPPDLIPLVEITRGDKSAQETADVVKAITSSLGKKPVIVQKDILGIIGNRLQYAVLRECLHIISTGAAGPEEVDAAMKYGPGFRYSVLGPLETVDLGGLDIFRDVSNYLYADLGAEQYDETLNRLADAGRYGVKTGAGFYDYVEGEGAAKVAWRNDVFRKQLELLEANPWKK